MHNLHRRIRMYMKKKIALNYVYYNRSAQSIAFIKNHAAFLYQIYIICLCSYTKNGKQMLDAQKHSLKPANCFVYSLIWNENCFNGTMWLAKFFHIIITIIAVMDLLSLLIIGVCLQVHSHKNYKGRKRIIVRYKETILIIMYKRTR